MVKSSKKQHLLLGIAKKKIEITFQSIGGFPIEIETKIIKLITYSLAIFKI